MEDTNTCFLCMEPIKYRVLTPCDHNSLCLNCYIRNTICYHNENCYYCQNPFKGYPIVSADPHLTKYADAKAKRPSFDSQYKLFLTDKEKIRNYIASLFHFVCPECSLKLPAFDVFASHVKVHKMRVCQICYASNRFLPGDTHVFHSNKEYQTHIKTQHPRCALCPNQIFFDHDELTKHMLENHHRCDVCAAENKIVWFKDAASLIEHMEKSHFICPECSIERPVSFATKGELLIHLKTVHGQKLPPIDISDFNSTPNDNNKNSNDNDDVESNNREVVERRRDLNRKFMSKLNELLNERDKTELMKVARNYVANKVTGEFFYNEYANYLGKEKDALFNDMVSFLPIPEKRLELIRIHTGYNSANHNQQPQKPPQDEQQNHLQNSNQIHQQNQNNQNYQRKNKKSYNRNQRRDFNQRQSNQNQRQNSQNQHQSIQNQHQDVRNHDLLNIQVPKKEKQNQIQNQPRQSVWSSIQPNQIQEKVDTSTTGKLEQTQSQVKIEKPQSKAQVSISINKKKAPAISFEISKPKGADDTENQPAVSIQARPQ